MEILKKSWKKRVVDNPIFVGFSVTAILFIKNKMR